MSNILNKRWVRYVLLVIVCVVICGVVSRLTSSFTDFDVIKLNEDNYFFEKVDDGDFYSDANIDAFAKKGVITFSGQIPDTDPATVDVATDIEIATIRLKAGTYTFTCFNEENPSWKTYYATGTYIVDGVTYTWYSDFDKAPNISENSNTVLGKTIELKKDADVKFEVHLCEGVKLKNIKAYPILVEGDKEGSLYASNFD